MRAVSDVILGDFALEVAGSNLFLEGDLQQDKAEEVPLRQRRSLETP